MLMLVTGSSCSGKSTLAQGCSGLAEVEVHDSDEHGVPSGADTAWRQRDLQRWVREALELDERGVDLVLTGQSPLGELLAVPDAPRLDLAVCLLDVEDRARLTRLDQRDPGRWSDDERGAFVGWARWHRAHRRDPGHHPEVITSSAASEMRWDRWSGWTSADPRWHTDTLDTSDRSTVDGAAALRDWVMAVRARRDAGTLPLGRGWDVRG